MPTAKIHVHQGRYDEQRLAKLGEAIQAALETVLNVPPDDYYRIVHLLPSHRFVHTPSFLGLTYSEDFILLELTFIAGRPKEPAGAAEGIERPRRGGHGHRTR